MPDFNYVSARNHMPAAFWCQPQIALAARRVANAARLAVPLTGAVGHRSDLPDPLPLLKRQYVCWISILLADSARDVGGRGGTRTPDPLLAAPNCGAPFRVDVRDRSTTGLGVRLLRALPGPRSLTDHNNCDVVSAAGLVGEIN
jgi:hypothetical protein